MYVGNLWIRRAKKGYWNWGSCPMKNFRNWIIIGYSGYLQNIVAFFNYFNGCISEWSQKNNDFDK